MQTQETSSEIKTICVSEMEMVQGGVTVVQGALIGAVIGAAAGPEGAAIGAAAGAAYAYFSG